MASVTTTSAAAELAQTRWRKPQNVERRVHALAEHIRRTVDSLPPLTEAQRSRLAALLTPADRPTRTEARAA